MKRALGALVVIALTGGAVWIGFGVGSGGSEPPSRLVDAKQPDLRRGPSEVSVPRCSEYMPFEPTYLPDGFSEKRFMGPFPGGRPPDDQSSIGGRPHEEQAIVHYRGTGGRAIEVRRPGTLFVELAQRSDAPTIEVLGTETTGFAPIGPRGNKFIVAFPYPGDAKPHQWCSRYSLNEYGVSLAELRKVAEGLRPR